MNDRLVWIDCEMTGLDLAKDVLVEVAVLITDYELNILDPGIDLVIKPPAAALEQMNEFVRSMHASSGLLDELDAGIDLADAEKQVLDYITSFVPEARKAPLAGNSIGTDRAFLAVGMPRVEEYVHYRNVDVSSIKELVRRWYPRVYFATPPKAGNHRALADITESIAELRYYRETVFVAQPGPDTETARTVSARLTAQAQHPIKDAHSPGTTAPDDMG